MNFFIRQILNAIILGVGLLMLIALRHEVRYGNLNPVVAAAGMMVFSGLIFIKLVLIWDYLQDAPKRVPKDVSQNQHRIPPNLQRTIYDLQQEGFVHLGQVKHEGLEKRHILWVLRDSNGMIVVEVGSLKENKIWLEYLTAFKSGAVLETQYPDGRQLNKPQYWARNNSTNPRAAYRQHLQDLQTFSQKEGPHRPIMHIEDYLKFQAYYYEKFIPYITGPLLIEAMATHLGSLLTLWAVFGAFLVYRGIA
jgi:hypothetical protein